MTTLDHKWLIKKRKTLGYTQVSLSHATGISLPTLQNIEAGKANPSWDILIKLLTTLKIEIKFQPAPLNWSALLHLGVPLMETDKNLQKTLLSSPERRQEFLRAIDELIEEHETIDERQKDSLLAYAMALRDHYPSLFRKYLANHTKEIEKKIKDSSPGRLIKLRRIALSRMNLEAFYDT